MTAVTVRNGMITTRQWTWWSGSADGTGQCGAGSLKLFVQMIPGRTTIEATANTAAHNRTKTSDAWLAQRDQLRNWLDVQKAGRVD